MKVPLLDYEPRTPFNEISNTFSLHSDMQYMEHQMDENALLSWAHVTQDTIKHRLSNLKTLSPWLPWLLTAILEFKVAATENYISAYLSIQIS